GLLWLIATGPDDAGPDGSAQGVEFRAYTDRDGGARRQCDGRLGRRFDDVVQVDHGLSGYEAHIADRYGRHRDAYRFLQSSDPQLRAVHAGASRGGNGARRKARLAGGGLLLPRG